MEKEAEKRIQDESIQSLYEAYNKLKLQHEQMVGAIQKDDSKKRDHPLEKVLLCRSSKTNIKDTILSIHSYGYDGLRFAYRYQDW